MDQHATATDRNASALAQMPSRLRRFWRAQIRAAQARAAAAAPPGYASARPAPSMPGPLDELAIVVEVPGDQALYTYGVIRPDETLDGARQREQRQAAERLHASLPEATRSSKGPEYWRGWRIAVYDGADCIHRAPVPDLLRSHS